MRKINLEELMSNIYYHPELTEHVGKKYAEKYPTFEAIAITPEPQSSIVFIFTDLMTGAIPFFLCEGIEAIRKEYHSGQWSPGEKNSPNQKVIFGYFTHQKEEFIRDMLKKLGISDDSEIKKIVNQFKDPKGLSKKPIQYEVKNQSQNKVSL